MKFEEQFHDIKNQFDVAWHPGFFSFKPQKDELKHLKSDVNAQRTGKIDLAVMSVMSSDDVFRCEFALRSNKHTPKSVEKFVTNINTELYRVQQFCRSRMKEIDTSYNDTALNDVVAFAGTGRTRDDVEEIRAFAQSIDEFIALSSKTYDDAFMDEILKFCCKQKSGFKSPRRVPWALQESLNLQKFAIFNVIAINRIFRKIDELFHSEVEKSGMKAMILTPLCTMPSALVILRDLQIALAQGIPNAEQFECSICLEIFRNPVTLPCQHTFCALCLQQVYKSGLTHCPMCRQECSLSPRNITLNKELAQQCVSLFPEESKAKAKTEEMIAKKITRLHFRSKIEQLTARI